MNKTDVVHSELTCSNTKKIDSLYEKWEYTNSNLVEEIEVLNDSIPKLLAMITDHKVVIATLDQKVSENETKVDKLDARQFDLVKEVSQTVGRKTITPTLISTLTLVTMIITIFVMYIK